jgi:hypothetical protein
MSTFKNLKPGDWIRVRARIERNDNFAVISYRFTTAVVTGNFGRWHVDALDLDGKLVVVDETNYVGPATWPEAEAALESQRTLEAQAQRDANWLAARDILLPLVQKAHDCGFYVDTVKPILEGQK